MSDSDSDDEFLALATGRGKKRAATSSKKNKKQAAKKSKTSKGSKKSKKSRRDDSDDATESDSDESSASSSSSDSDASSASSAPVVRPKRVSRVSRSSARQVSDDEVPAGGGEASDDEEDAELERLRKETDPYGEDGYGDAQDRKTLMAMTELERQTILADRGEKRQAYMERLELRQRLKESKGGKTRQSTARTTKPGRGISELKDRRNAKKQGKSALSDSDDDRKTKRRPVCTISLQQLQKITLRRVDLAKWDMYPYFNDIVTGCFVRFLLPPSKPGDKPTYRICKVEEVQTYKRTYKVEPHATQMSNTGLYLSHGSAKKAFAMDNVSNSPASMEEFERWKKVMESDFEQFPEADYVEKKAAALEKQRIRPNTKDEVSAMLARKSQLRTGPTNVAEARAKLTLERERAVIQRKPDEVERIDEELARLNEVSKTRGVQSSQMEQFAEINRRNRDRDMSRGNRVAQDERAAQGLSPAITAITSPGRGVSPGIGAPSPALRGISPGLSPRPSASPGPVVGIGITLDREPTPGSVATDSQAVNGKAVPPPLPAINVNVDIDDPKLSLEKALAGYDFDDDLPPPEAGDMLI